MLSISPVKINTFLPKQTKSNLKRQTQSDAFIKSSQINFKGSISFIEQTKNVKTSIYSNNSQNLVALWEQDPRQVEDVLQFLNELYPFEDERIDRIFGFKEAGKSLNIYKNSLASKSRSKYCSLLNETLLLNRNNKVLSPLLLKIAKNNPEFFKKENIISMYANNECEETISVLAQNDPEKVFLAFEQIIHTYDRGNSKKHLAIENIKITPQRQKVFETLFEIDPLRTSYILSALPSARKNELKFSQGNENPDVKAILEAINSKDDVLEVNKKLLDLYDKSNKSLTSALLTLNNKTGELYINSMMKDKNYNYYGIMLYLLLKDPDSFFELAKKSDFIWHAATNEKQSYLELLEQALFVDPKKTGEILAKPISNRLVYPRSTPIMECIDNKSFDYSELLKAFYQEDKDIAFKLFATHVNKTCISDNGTNLLTYYINQKGYKAEDFISYLTNQNLRFVKSLLSNETLTKIKDLSYKTAMQNLQRTRAELENEFGRKLSESEERVMKRIAGVETEMRKEVKRLDGKISDLSNYTDKLAEQVHKHLFPPSSSSNPDCGFIPSDFFESNTFSAEAYYDSKVRNNMLTWYHEYPSKPYGPGVI